MNRLSIALALVAALATSLIAADEKIKAPATAPTTQGAVNKFCPIEPKHPVDPQVTIQHDGKTVGFCCEDCIPEFKKNPEKYTKSMK